MVFGLVVRSRGLGGNLMASLRSLGGGEIHEYTSLLEDTRRQALDRLVQNATLIGRQRHPLDALRQLGARRHDERDRRLRHGRRSSCRTRRRRPRADDGRWAVSALARRLVVARRRSLLAAGGLLLIARGAGGPADRRALAASSAGWR